MLAKIAGKQSRAVSVVMAALANAGILNRSVCVSVSNWHYDHCGAGLNVSVFVTAESGANTEPFYVTGHSIAEAVRNMRDAIKGKANDAGALGIQAPF